MSIISIKNLTYKSIFENLNLQIDSNELISISGANNCGKTTLTRILDGQISEKFDIKINEKNIYEYKSDELSKTIQTIIPFEVLFIENTLYEELNINTYGNTELYDFIIRGLKLKRILEQNLNTLNKKDIILSQISISLAMNPKILLIDNISPYFNKKEMESILIFLKNYQEKFDTTIIYTTINLEESLFADKLYIINDGKIELEGKPIELLEKDNIINKIGLNIPFMIDLSVKLRDYDLLKEIEMNKDRMVDKLWN